MKSMDKHVIVSIDYFSKWSKAKAAINKSAPTVVNFFRAR